MPVPAVRNDTLCEADYPSIKYWHKQTWTDAYKLLSKQNKGKKRTTDSIKYYFIENDNGDLVSPARHKQIKDAGRAFIYGLEHKYAGKMPDSWGKLPLEDRTAFEDEMGRLFEELTRGAGYWKGHQVGQISYAIHSAKLRRLAGIKPEPGDEEALADDDSAESQDDGTPGPSSVGAGKRRAEAGLSMPPPAKKNRTPNASASTSSAPTASTSAAIPVLVNPLCVPCVPSLPCAACTHI